MGHPKRHQDVPSDIRSAPNQNPLKVYCVAPFHFPGIIPPTPLAGAKRGLKVEQTAWLEKAGGHTKLGAAFRGAVLAYSSTFDPLPSTPNPQPSTLQPSTLNPQLSTLNPQPSTLKPQLSTRNPQPATLNPQPSTRKPQPATLNPQPSTRYPQPSTLNPQPLTLNSEPWHNRR